MKRLFCAIALSLLSLSLLAGPTGGIKGVIVDRSGRTPIAGADLQLKEGETSLAVGKTLPDGSFSFPELINGNYTIEVSASGYMGTSIFATVEGGLVRDVMTVSLSSERTASNDLDDSAFTEFDMTDSGYSDNPTILFNGNDVFSNVAGYGFSNVRYKNRGLNSETQDVCLAGVKMNDALTGYSPYSLWSGLNEAMRSKETTVGLSGHDASLGRYNGVTDIAGNPSSVRKGWRFSALTNSAMYRLRVMGTYASGPLDNGWSFAANISARVGGNDWIKGVYYRNFSYYLGAEKKFDSGNRLSLVSFASTGERGASNASTQEVYDLMGDNMYNSNWGYQNGKMRNSRVRRTFEPVTFLKYTNTASEKLTLNTVLLWRTGFNGYTALDWYDASDPRPDYYRNLPSYFYMADESYDRNSEAKAEWAKEMWTNKAADFEKYKHLDWDRLYNVNYNNPDGRSKYALEERHVDQNDIHFTQNVSWRQSSVFKLDGGLDARFDIARNYKKMDDLLGGKYYLNVDSFAERDFAVSSAKIQNDLDYYIAHGEAEKIGKVGIYGYNYMAYVFDAGLWTNAALSLGSLDLSLGLRGGYDSFWRKGLYRKGLFAGANDDGSHIIVDGEDLTEASNGQTSKGNSDKSRFFVYSAKLAASYTFIGGHRVSANAGYFKEAPTFKNSFISPRTRNTLVSDLRPQRTFSADLNYEYNNNGLSGRITAYYTKIKDMTKVMSFYDDSQNSFTNFAMSGIDQRHVGVELGVKVPLPVSGLSATGVFAWGNHVYTSDPHMVQTIDNSAETVRDDVVKYWQSHPVYSRVKDPYTGKMVVEYDFDGNPVVDHYQKHYVPSSPQLAAQLGLNYRTKSYWFFELNGQYFAKSYLDMNPLYRTSFACAGPDNVETPEEVEYMASQEEFSPCFLLNASVGKSWYLHYKYNFGFSLSVNNITNNRNVKTGGYEQTRLANTSDKTSYRKFDSKYFYMSGINYMLNLYFKF